MKIKSFTDIHMKIVSHSYSGYTVYMLVAGYLRAFLFSQILELHCILYNNLAMNALINTSLSNFAILTFLFSITSSIFSY